ncbi:MAG: DNA polymerase III subunit gamma/tau [Candidatus Saganbacteria bacterium]|nr:DNA polymerase III subunit gamma/tau [Candidatus Saganbacteria bacterium]
MEGKYKVYIIDEVHMLTSEAFNALLKTLEEPPKHVVFVLATTDPQRVPVTIWSRCQRLDFRKISLVKIMEQLKAIAKSEKIEIEERALFMVGRSASGSMRDAISLLDQLISFAGNKIKIEDVVTVLGGAEEGVLFGFGDALAKGETKIVMELLEKNVEEGKSVLQITKDLIVHFRYLLFAKLGIQELIDLSTEQQKEILGQAESYSEANLKRIVRIFSRAQLDMKWQPQARIVLETALLEIMVEAKNEKGEEKADKADKVEEKRPVAIVAKKEEELSKPIETPMVASSGNGFMEKLTRNWEQVLEKVKGKTLFGYVSLHEGRPVGMNEKGRLMIEFKKGFSFHKQRLEDKLNKDAVEEAIAEITGQKVLIEGMVADRVDDSDPVSKVREGEGFSLEKVKEMFGGKIL